MYRESLDALIYHFNRREKSARLFTFAMSALGLFVIVGLIGLSTWGFASYTATRNTLLETSQQLEDSHKKIGELESIANSNTSNAELIKVREELSNVQQLVVTKDAEIADLKSRIGSGVAPGPTNQSGGQADCTQCRATVEQQNSRIKELLDQNKVLNERLNNCPELMKRCRNSAAGSSAVNKPGGIQ